LGHKNDNRWKIIMTLLQMMDIVSPWGILIIRWKTGNLIKGNWSKESITNEKKL
jgi:hypothetical protein